MKVICSTRFAAIVASLATLAGCGQKGPLYLPSEATDVVTRPAQTPSSATPVTSGAPDTPQSSDSPQAAPNPAPEVTAPDKDKKQQGTQAPR